MSREQIDAAIRRHAEFELLYDKPYEDTKKVRVSGPFTVESLSPHRSLAFAGSAVDGTGALNADDVDDASRRRRVVRADDPREPPHRGHPERPQGRAADVRHGRAVCGCLHPGRRGAGGRSRRDAEAGRDHDRPAVRDGRPVVHQGRCPGGEPGRRPRPAVRARVRVRPVGAGDRRRLRDLRGGLRQRRRRAPAWAGAGAAGADERRPGDG